MTYDYKDLREYKGYGIQKAWWVDCDGCRIKSKPCFYLVYDEEDYIGEEFNSLKDAKKYVDSL